MATLTSQDITRTGLDIAGVAASGGGDQWTNYGSQALVVRNGGGSSITVTLQIQATVDGQTVNNPTVTVPAGVTKVIGPFPLNVYNDGASVAKVTYSSVTSVFVAVIKAVAFAQG